MVGDQLREFAAEPGEPEGPGPAGEGASGLLRARRHRVPWKLRSGSAPRGDSPPAAADSEQQSRGASRRPLARQPQLSPFVLQK